MYVIKKNRRISVARHICAYNGCNADINVLEEAVRWAMVKSYKNNMADHLQAYKLHGRAENRDGWIALDTIGFYVDWRNYRGRAA